MMKRSPFYNPTLFLLLSLFVATSSERTTYPAARNLKRPKKKSVDTSARQVPEDYSTDYKEANNNNDPAPTDSSSSSSSFLRTSSPLAAPIPSPMNTDPPSLEEETTMYPAPTNNLQPIRVVASPAPSRIQTMVPTPITSQSTDIATIVDDYDVEERVTITVQILFDDQPQQIGWTIQDLSTNKLVILRVPGTYESGTRSMQENFELVADGRAYAFGIEDLEGDGLVDNKLGSYTVRLADGTAFLALGGGDFGHAQVVTFKIPLPPTTDTPPVIRPDRFTIDIFIQFDDYPDDIGWMIEDDTTNEILASRSPGYYPVGTKVANEQVSLIGGRSYIFGIEDTRGDGLCCQVPGYYSVTLDDGVVLASGESDFGGFEFSSFALPTQATTDNNGANVGLPADR